MLLRMKTGGTWIALNLDAGFEEHVQSLGS
jgi:hypothetical protein